MVGRKSATWLLLSALAGLGLAVVEVQLSVFIQLFLHSIGIPIQVDPGVFSLLPRSTSLTGLMGLLVAIGVGRATFQLLVSQSASIAQESISARLRLIALHDLLYSHHNRYVSAAATHTRLGEIFPRTSQFFYHLAQGIPLLLVAGVITLTLFTVSFYSACLSVAGLFFLAGLLWILNSHIRPYANRVPQEQEGLLTGVERVARNWLLVRILRTQNREFAQLSNNILNYASHAIRAQILAASGVFIPQMLGVCLLVGILLVNLTLLHTPAAQLVAFLYLFLRLVQTLSQSAAFLGVAAVLRPNARLTAQYLATFSPETIQRATRLTGEIRSVGGERILASSAGMHTPQARPHTPPAIDVHDLTFRYQANGNPIFQTFHLHVPAGQQLGIVGESGKGKSTLLALILGILPPEAGSVTMGGVSAETYLHTYTDFVGFVGAEPFLIAGTIADNLNYGACRPYTPDEYRDALHRASLLSLIESLPQGLAHLIQENGEGLSAGQKQRLALARALLRQPLLLILDEFTANLDATTEREIVTSLATLKGSCTILLVSHRPEALAYTDVRIEL